MKLNKNIVSKELTTTDEWLVLAPPQGGASQWRDGRSAKELANYITASLPNVPKELDDLLSGFSQPDAAFDWSAEYVTNFQKHGYGKGNGRNHDLIIHNSDVFVGVEAKADEPFGDKTVAEEWKDASENKKTRIEKLVKLVFGDAVEDHMSLRYQLLTATGGILLEAKERRIQNAVLAVLVFLKKGTNAEGKPYYREENRLRNNADWAEFLDQLQATEIQKGMFKAAIPDSCEGISLYLQKIEIHVD